MCYSVREIKKVAIGSIFFKTVWNMMKEKFFRKNDIFFVAATLFVAVTVYLTMHMVYGTEGTSVQIVVDGEVYAEYSLEQDREIQIDYDKSEGFNVLIIENGEAVVKEADCPDKLCVKQKAVSKNGESIVCLPHKLVITIVGGEEAEYDGFTG